MSRKAFEEEVITALSKAAGEYRLDANPRTRRRLLAEVSKALNLREDEITRPIMRAAWGAESALPREDWGRWYHKQIATRHKSS